MSTLTAAQKRRQSEEQARLRRAAQRQQNKPLGQDLIDGALRFLAPVANQVNNVRNNINRTLDNTPVVGPALKQLDRALAPAAERALRAEDRLPASRVAQGAGIVTQKALGAANVDPRIGMVLAPLLIGRVNAGSADDAAKSLQRAQRASQRSDGFAVRIGPDGKPVAIPPSTRANRASNDAIRKAQVAADPPSAYPNWQQGRPTPGGTTTTAKPNPNASRNQAQQQRLNRAQDALRVQGVTGPFAGKPIGGKPPTAREQRALDRFFSGGNTASTFPSKKGKDITDPRYGDAGAVNAWDDQQDYLGDRFNDSGGFSSGGNTGRHNVSTDITNEGVGRRGQVGPLKKSLNKKREKAGKAPLGKSQEAEAVNDLLDQYRFPEQYNQLEARDNGGVELPTRTGAVDPRRPQLGPRQKPKADTKHKDNIHGGRRIEQSNPERARRAQERLKVQRARGAQGGKGADDGGVNWKDNPTTTQRSLPVQPERQAQVSRAADAQIQRRISENTLDDEYSILNPEAAARFRRREASGRGNMPGRVLPPTSKGPGSDPRSNRTDPNSITRKGRAADVDRARQRQLGLEPEPDKNRQGKKGNTTNWERSGVRTVGLPANRQAAERIARRLEQREAARTGTPNINRNASQQHAARGDYRNAKPAGYGQAPGTPAPRPASSTKRPAAAVSKGEAQRQALEAQRAGDQFSEFKDGGELRGTKVITGNKLVGINKNQIKGRDPAEGGRTTQAASQAQANRERRATARGAKVRTNKDGSPNKADLKAQTRAQAEMAKAKAEMERIRAARARRRRSQ